MSLLEVSIQSIQPTHKITLKCQDDGEVVVAMAAKVKPPGARRSVWVYPYGLPHCPKCGGTLAKLK